MKRSRKWLTLVIAWIMLISLAGCAGRASEEAKQEETNLLTETANWLLQEVEEPNLGPVAGEWTILSLARSERDLPEGYLEGYYDRLCAAVKEKKGVLHEKKYTEYSRVILALTAMGKDPSDVAGYNLLQPLADQKQTVFQGVNGAAYALLALDSGCYEVPEAPDAEMQASRDSYIAWIMEKEVPEGGWGFDGKTADTDITSMVLQALAKYRDREDVAAAVERAVVCLSEQYRNGTLVSQSTCSSETYSQLIVALTELGISVEDERFVAEEKTLLDQLLTYRTEEGGFRHTMQETKANLMATEQAFYAMVAIDRMEQGKTSLYRMN